MNDKRLCAMVVWPAGAMHARRCSRTTGLLLEDGKLWCRQHAPSTLMVKEAKRAVRRVAGLIAQAKASELARYNLAAGIACRDAGLSIKALDAGAVKDMMDALRMTHEALGMMPQMLTASERTAFDSSTAALAKIKEANHG